LQKAAQEKAEATAQRVDDAIRLLLKERKPINFKVVAETARVSTAWLYAHEEIKQRIIHLRASQSPKASLALPLREQASNASKDAVIAALRKKAKEQEEEIHQLKRQLEVAYGHLYQQGKG
jgi:TPP-dependent 2-oxoacid decarboxylase